MNREVPSARTSVVRFSDDRGTDHLESIKEAESVDYPQLMNNFRVARLDSVETADAHNDVIPISLLVSQELKRRKTLASSQDSTGKLSDTSEKKDALDPKGVIPIAHPEVKDRISTIPLLQRVSPIVRRYLMEMPHAYLERLDFGEEIKMKDLNFEMDYICVLKGGVEVSLELGQIEKVLGE